jgi:hypothetical protein
MTETQSPVQLTPIELIEGAFWRRHKAIVDLEAAKAALDKAKSHLNAALVTNLPTIIGGYPDCCVIHGNNGAYVIVCTEGGLDISNVKSASVELK